jgi:mannitol/fructose-specific phosphotransferase system IIA component (Ntr-type)
VRLGSLVRPELIYNDLAATDRPGILRAMAERVAAQGLVGDAGELFAKLWERESLGTTGIGAGIAIPHCKIQGLAQGVVAVGISQQGIDFAALDAQPVHVLFLVVSPAESPAEHLQVLAAISRWIKGGRHAEILRSLHSAEDLYRFLAEEAA